MHDGKQRGGLSHAKSFARETFDLLKSDGQFLAATTTTARQHATAVLGGHTGAETMHLIALAFLGLVSTLHTNNSFSFKDLMALMLRSVIKSTTRQPL